MIAVIIIIAVVTGAIAVITAATRTQPGRHTTSNPAGEEDTFVAELRGQPADRFTPGVVLPRTPQLGEPLKPLPDPDPREVDWDPHRDGPNLCHGCLSNAHCDGGASFCECTCGLPDDWADEIGKLVDHAAEHFNPRPGDQPKPRPPHAADGQTTGEIFEHMCVDDPCWCKPWEAPPPPVPPAEIVAGLNGHYTVEAAVESMFTRAQAEQVRALANGQVSDG